MKVSDDYVSLGRQTVPLNKKEKMGYSYRKRADALCYKIPIPMTVDQLHATDPTQFDLYDYYAIRFSEGYNGFMCYRKSKNGRYSQIHVLPIPLIQMLAKEYKKLKDNEEEAEYSVRSIEDADV